MRSCARRPFGRIRSVWRSVWAPVWPSVWAGVCWEWLAAGRVLPVGCCRSSVRCQGVKSIPGRRRRFSGSHCGFAAPLDVCTRSPRNVGARPNGPPLAPAATFSGFGGSVSGLRPSRFLPQAVPAPSSEVRGRGAANGLPGPGSIVIARRASVDCIICLRGVAALPDDATLGVPDRAGPDELPSGSLSTYT